MTVPADPRVLCVVKRFAHHTANGGYDRLAEFLGTSVIRRPAMSGLAGRIADGLWRKSGISRAAHGQYNLADRIAEERAFLQALTGRFDIIHALYGDEQVDQLLRRTHLLHARLVLSVHYPLWRLQELFAGLTAPQRDRIGGIVAVGARDVPGLMRLFGEDKVIYGPLGTDVVAFRPDPARRRPDRPRFLFVGWHMRDFDVAHRAIDLCASRGVEADFDIVVREDKHMFFTGCRNVRAHSGISEAALLQLNQQADALFLPLTDATANQAILEALACGTPVITTDVGSVGGYLDASCGWLLPPGDAEAAFDCLAAIVADRAVAETKRAAARHRAETFTWEATAVPIRAAYLRLLQTGRFAA